MEKLVLADGKEPGYWSGRPRFRLFSRDQDFLISGAQITHRGADLGDWLPDAPNLRVGVLK